MLANILLVDDNAIQAATRKAILDRYFRPIAVAPSGSEALRMLSDPEFLASIRMVITDHLMPVMRGTDFVREVRQLRPDLPILVLSGIADAESEYEMLDIIFRTKPFAPAHLIALTQEILAEPMSRTA